jgi:hypothetical protein
MTTTVTIILLALSTGLFFSIRAIVLRRHIGCGIAGIIIILLTVASPFVFIYWITSVPPTGFKQEMYQTVIGLEYPASAKVVKQIYSHNGWMDYAEGIVIEVDTADYRLALQAMQSGFTHNTDCQWPVGGIGRQLLLDAGIGNDQIAFLHEEGGTHRRVAGFHRNGRIIILEKFRN